MLAIRFILGMFEAGIAPSAMNIISMWYPRDEAPFRMCIVLGFNGLAAMVGALLGFSVGHVHDVAIHPWQLIFIVIGGMNFVWGIVFLLIIPDTPKNARFLSHKEKVVATWRSSKSMVGIKTKEFKPKQAVEALCDFNVWCTTLLGATAGIIIGGVGNFATSLIKGFGFPGERKRI